MPWVQQHCQEVRHVCEKKSGLSCQRMMVPTSSTRLDQTKREWRGGYIQHHYRNTAKNWSFTQPCHPMPSDSHWVEAYCWIATAPYAGRILRGTSQKCTGEREFEAVKPNVDHGSFAPFWTSCCKVCISWLWGGMKFWLMTVWKEKRTPQGPTKCAFCQVSQVLMEHSHQCCHSTLRSIRSTWSRQLFWPSAKNRWILARKAANLPQVFGQKSSQSFPIHSSHRWFWILACDPKLTKRSTCKNHEDKLRWEVVSSMALPSGND